MAITSSSLQQIPSTEMESPQTNKNGVLVITFSEADERKHRLDSWNRPRDKISRMKSDCVTQREPREFTESRNRRSERRTVFLTKDVDEMQKTWAEMLQIYNCDVLKDEIVDSGQNQQSFA